MIDFYLHTPLDNQKELKALVPLARTLKQRLDKKEEQYYLIASVNPQKQESLKRRGLTELDGIFIGPHGISLIEFKACSDPFDGSQIEKPWPILNSTEERNVSAGNSKNPFEQTQKARDKLKKRFFRKYVNDLIAWEEGKQLSWHEISSCIIFTPFLHPESAKSMQNLTNQHIWFNPYGLDKIDELAFTTRSKLKLSASQQIKLIEEIFEAKLWEDVHAIIDHQIGELLIKGVNNTKGRDLYRYEEISIGRSSVNSIKLPKDFIHVSRTHARLLIEENKVFLQNNDPTHGTYVNGNRMTPNGVIELHGNEQVYLGGIREGAAHLIFLKKFGEGDTTEPTALE